MTDDQQPQNKDEGGKRKAEPTTGLSAFWSELKRRHVVRVAITYAVVAWLIIQIAVSTFEGFGIPVWAFRFVVIMLLSFFPVAIILAWAFELTPEGIKTSKKAKEEHPEAHKDESHAKKRHWFSLGLAAAVPTLIFGVLALFFFIRSGSDSESTISEKSIAVLPLANMSPDPENAFFADGVHEDVLTNLSKIKELHVIGRTSTLQYRDTVKTLQQIGEELNVRYLLEGSVRRARDRVLVTVQLIDAQSEGHLWAENYSRELDDIFAIQADVAKQIAEQLQAVISRQALPQKEIRPTENQEAYDAYLLAGNRDITPRDEIGALLEEAVTLDPQFYQAWAELARYRIEVWNNARNRQDAELYSEAHLAMGNAKRLAPESPEVLVAEASFAYSEEDDLGLSIDYSVKARLKGLSSSNIGYRYLQLGQLDKAQLNLEEYIRMNPYPQLTHIRLFNTYILKEMWNEAEAFTERNLELLAGSELSNTLLFWQERYSFLDFIRTADDSAYKLQAKNRVSYSDPSGQRNYSILSRNLSDSLRIIETRSNAVNLMVMGRMAAGLIGFRINPADIVAALIHFELDEKDDSLERAEEVRSNLEQAVSGSHKIKPQNLAALAICYALDNDLEKVDSTIPKIRALTEDVNWKYRAQVECEMHIAIAYLVLGDHEKAIETLEAASKMDGPIFLNRELDLWFIFDRLRGDPRFDALLN